MILGIAVGPLIDRWPRQRMMILSDLGGVAAFGALPFVHSPGGICAISAFAGFSAAFFRPGCYSAIPNLVAEDSLMAGNALMQGAENLATLIGPVLAAVGVITIGAHAVYGLNAASFLFSALLLVRIGNRLQSEMPARIGRTHWREVASGIALVRDNSYLSSIFLIWSWATLAYTGINVAEIVLAKSQDQGYGTGSLGFGIFVAASALGAVFGTFVAKGFIERMRVYGGYRASFLVTAAGVVICAVSPGLVVGCVGAVIYGVGNGVGLVCNVTLIQQTVPDERRGQIFAVLGSLVQTFTLARHPGRGPRHRRDRAPADLGRQRRPPDHRVRERRHRHVDACTPREARRARRHATRRAGARRACDVERRRPQAPAGAGHLTPGRDRPDARCRRRARIRHPQPEALHAAHGRRR